MTDVKYMDIREFRESGFLQEANRQFFHPLGLALETVIGNCRRCGGDGETLDPADDDWGGGKEPARVRCPGCGGSGQVERLGGVWDYRDDPEGMTFSAGVLSREKALNVLREARRHDTQRRAMFDGRAIQPVPGRAEGVE